MSLAEQMQSLYTKVGHLPGITVELHKSLVAIGIRNEAASATVFLQGAQVTHYQHANEPAILWCSDQCQYTPGKSLRGGIPVCWPWFGDLQRNPEHIQQQIPTYNSAPAHGFVREKNWQLDTIEKVSNERTYLRLSLAIAAGTEPLWPFATHLQYEVWVGKTLEITFTVKNLDDRAFSYSTALHTYLSISSVDQVEIDGLQQVPFFDTLSAWSEGVESDSINVQAEIDRVYTDTPTEIRLHDKLLGRQVSLSSHNSHSCVVWNPWIDKAKRLSDFADDAYRNMMCIETAKLLQDQVTLKPGHEYLLDLCIGIKS